MDAFVLKRYRNGGSDTKHHYLSLVSRLEDGWSVLRTLDLPFFDNDEEVYGNSCRGLVCLSGRKGTVVVCNLSRSQWKVLPPPSRDDLYFETPVQLSACGLGYDIESNDYKILRMYFQYKTGKKKYKYYGCEYYTEVYSLRSGSWKKIETPAARIAYPSALYYDGCLYWTSALDDCFGGEDHHPGVDNHILIFNLGTEKFDHLSFPDSSLADDGYAIVSEFRGLLAALIHSIPGPAESLHMHIFVRRENIWNLLFDISLDHVSRPLDIGKRHNNYVLYLEGNGRELVVYDFELKHLKGSGISSDQSALIPASMIALCFDFFDIAWIPDSTPMPFHL